MHVAEAQRSKFEHACPVAAAKQRRTGMGRLPRTFYAFADANKNQHSSNELGERKWQRARGTTSPRSKVAFDTKERTRVSA